jgi:hypothetical protein
LYEPGRADDDADADTSARLVCVLAAAVAEKFVNAEPSRRLSDADCNRETSPDSSVQAALRFSPADS